MSLDIDHLVTLGQTAIDLDTQGKHEMAQAVREEMEEMVDKEVIQVISQAPQGKALQLQLEYSKAKNDNPFSCPVERAAYAYEKMIQKFLELNEQLQAFSKG